MCSYRQSPPVYTQVAGENGSPSPALPPRPNRRADAERAWQPAAWGPAALIALSLGLVACASPTRPSWLGIETQVYPAGVIPAVQARWETDPRSEVLVRAAANLTDRQDYGEHDDERGGGGGLGVGWRRYREPSQQGWLYGVRLDVWRLEIDWTDLPGEPGETSGETTIWVAQPSLEGGYGWRLSEGLRLELALGLGAEINVSTDGEDVGEGAILLFGATLLF
jgi:hypothetical protein